MNAPIPIQEDINYRLDNGSHIPIEDIAIVLEIEKGVTRFYVHGIIKKFQIKYSLFFTHLPPLLQTRYLEIFDTDN